MPLKKCLIANRGEIALRIIRACRELNIHAVAVFSSADATAPHVQQADSAYLIGAPPPAESYLNIPKLIDVALASGCDCVHPGYGFLSENADFAQAIIDAGLTWIGPPPAVIRLMGVKTTARAHMQAAGVPLVPGFQSDTADDAAFLQAAEQIGYPVMVKAAGGGGGKGIRIVHHPDDLLQALASARREADKAFGDARIFLERYIESGRHIEVQIIADAHGNTVHLYERECSAQRRHQKIIEESPSPLLDADTRHAITHAAVTAAQAVGYVNAGTVEFIATPDREFFFLEMNTRLQVEHPVTELVTGVDVVHLQFHIASGGVLPFTQAEVIPQGHAIEARLYAEDPQNHFLPATGTIHAFHPPHLPGLRIDSGITSGAEVTIHYDPMLAKLIVYARTRAEAIQRLRHALQQTVVLGTTTNRAFLLALLDDPRFQSGNIDTAYIDQNLAALLPAPPSAPLAALIAAAYLDFTASPALPSGANADADLFSAWSIPDGFRL